MENNWKEKAEEIAETNIEDCFEIENITRAMLEFGNLVFEATKKECADKAYLGTKTEHTYQSFYEKERKEMGYTVVIDKESILDINKPNL